MLQNVPILAGLGEAALNLPWERASAGQAPAGRIIVREGDAGNRFFLVGEGTVRVCKHCGQSDEVELARFGTPPLTVTSLSLVLKVFELRFFPTDKFPCG